MGRGRPKSLLLTDEKAKTIQLLIAEVTHDNCGTPGCQTKMHLGEASEIMDKLRENGYIIKEGS